ncbi:MFS transporter [Dongia sp.]|uniref:MFS transporter n=1 Tax=Dongia sp. TaxID=1977262 RepID=UPI0035B32ADB
MAPSIWRHTDFRRLMAALAVSQLGSKLAREALPLTAVLVLGAGPMGMTYLGIAAALPALLMALHAGAFLDRVRRRPSMIAADFARFLLLLSVPVAALAGHLGMVQLCLIAFIVSSLTLAFDIADQAYLPGLVGRDEILKANAAKEASLATTEIAGPPLGGLMVQAFGGPLTILIDAVSYLFSGIFLLRIKSPEPPPAPRAQVGILLEIRAGLRLMARDDILRPLLWSRFARAFFSGMIGPFYVLYLVGELKLSPGMLGLIVATGGAASLAGAALAPALAARFPIGPGLILAFALKTSGLACVPLAGLFSGASPMLMIGLLIAQQILGDGSTGYFAVVERTLRQRRVPPEYLARTGATIRLINDGSMPFAIVLAGVLAQTLGLNIILWIAVTGYALAPVIAFFSDVRKLRSL